MAISLKIQPPLIDGIFGSFGFLLFNVLVWPQLSIISPTERTALRFLLCFLVLSVFLLPQSAPQLRQIFAAKNRIIWITLSALLLGANCFLIIFCCGSHKIMEAGLGIYMGHLGTTFIGLLRQSKSSSLKRLIFKDVRYLIIASVALLLIVRIITLIPFPVFGLLIGASWIGRNVLLNFKLSQENTTQICLIEHGILALFSLVYLSLVITTAQTSLLSLSSINLLKLLLGCGGSIIPVYLSTKASQRLSLIKAGFLGLISPLGTLIFGYFLDH